MTRPTLLLLLSLAACAPEAPPPAYVQGASVTVPLPSPDGPAWDGPDRDCDDFATQAEAQSFFETGARDRHHLDADRDGTACESLL